MYPVVLAIHNILRWVVLLLGVWALFLSYRGWLGKLPWSGSDRKTGVFFSAAIDTQVLLGLILYVFLSPITRSAFSDFGAAMSDPGARFFAIEHIFYMLLAMIFAHLGSALAKRATQDSAKHQRAALWYSLAMIVILVGMPWMRALLPGM